MLLNHTPPYPIHHLPYTMLTAVFFQIQAESREQQVPAVKSLHHTPPYPIHHLPYTMLTAVFFQIQAESSEQQVPAVKVRV